MKLSVISIELALVIFNSFVETSDVDGLFVTKGDKSCEVVYDIRTKAQHLIQLYFNRKGNYVQFHKRFFMESSKKEYIEQRYFDLFVCDFRKMAEQMHSVSDLSKLNDLKFKKRPILAEFYTEWCPPCKPIRNLLQKEMKNNNGKFTFASINCDQSDELSLQYEIDGVPTVVALICDEKLTVFDKITGYHSDSFKAFLEKVNKEL